MGDRPEEERDHLRRLIDHAAHLLPAQGPITVFIHHNTLHAFEDRPFTSAVEHGAEVFGCQPYLPKERYRAELARGRIRFEDLEAVLRDDLRDRAEERVVLDCTRFRLRRAMLEHRLPSGTTDELLWFVGETDALRQVRPEMSLSDRARLVSETRRWALRDLRPGATTVWADLFARCGSGPVEDWGPEAWEALALNALWRVCRAGAAAARPLPPEAPRPVRVRDLLVQVTGTDPDLLVHDLLIRFCAAFLDQGLAGWALPRREEGFLPAFCALYGQPGGPPEPWRRGLTAELARQAASYGHPLDWVRGSLKTLGVPEPDWAEYLSATLLALRGWAGMIRFLEERGDRAVHPAPEGSLVEFLAVRLVLDGLAAAHVARETIGFTGAPSALREKLLARTPPAPPSTEQRAFLIFQLAQVLGWTPEEMAGLTPADWDALFGEVEAFHPAERRRLFHLAYERRFYVRALDAVQVHAARPAPTPPRPRFQAIFCLDEREESVRRHLEEVAPDAETFGTAGFFSVAMYFKGAADAHYTPLCPAVMVPSHWVAEEEVADPAAGHWRPGLRRAAGAAAYRVHVGSRMFLAGALLAVAGVFAGIPLVARTLFPRLTARLRRRAGAIVRPTVTRLRLERTDPTPGALGGRVGFTVPEMTDIAEKVLRDTGLTRQFSRLVFVVGHGSSSLNNPHESAYDCGACGGSRGGPNARALAQILNDPPIRAGLAGRGITVPADIGFVGGLHNTSSDEVGLYDLDRLPDSHRAEFDRACADLDRAAERNAHERARRFESAPLSLFPAAARRHVEGRAEDLSQARPEAGHATNALCVVGRRARTRGLFLDRRAFLNSYDPYQDADGTVLARTLQAVFPVCGGINLEYFFSYVDNTGYGCGTKLPHNITSLLGVMDGAGSDLRTGLPWQMVEIHEPVRLLIVLETWPETLLKILETNPALGRLARNEWVRLALLDPDSPAIRVYRDGAFQPYLAETDRLPRAPSSADWYRGWRDHLDFAAIRGEPDRA